jgi:hypothetical protein
MESTVQPESSRLKELRIRAGRLAAGQKNSEDVRTLLLFLREKKYSSNSEILEEVGHFIAHPDKRVKGLTTIRARDTFNVARFKFKYMDETRRDRLPKNTPDVVKSAFRLLDIKFITKQTGLKYNKAAELVQKIERCFETSADGFIRWTNKFPEDNKIVELGLSVIVSKPAFTQKQFEVEFIRALRNCGIIAKNQERDFAAVAPYIALVTLCVMHNIQLELEDGWIANLSLANHPSGKLEISAIASLEAPNGNVNIAFPIFMTDLLIRENCSKALITNHDAWDFPLEVGADGKITEMK